jgi:hypothetical protein
MNPECYERFAVGERVLVSDWEPGPIGDWLKNFANPAIFMEDVIWRQGTVFRDNTRIEPLFLSLPVERFYVVKLDRFRWYHLFRSTIKVSGIRLRKFGVLDHLADV